MIIIIIIKLTSSSVIIIIIIIIIIVTITIIIIIIIGWHYLDIGPAVSRGGSRRRPAHGPRGRSAASGRPAFRGFRVLGG